MSWACQRYLHLRCISHSLAPSRPLSLPTPQAHPSFCQHCAEDLLAPGFMEGLGWEKASVSGDVAAVARWADGCSCCCWSPSCRIDHHTPGAAARLAR